MTERQQDPDPLSEPEKIVFRLSRSVWKQRSSLNMNQNGDSDSDAAVQVADREKHDSISPPRRRSVPTKTASFNPSGCNQCSTMTTCNHCIRRKEQELLAIKSQYESLKKATLTQSQLHRTIPFDKNASAKNCTSPDSRTGKSSALPKSKSPVSKAVKKGEEKPAPKKPGRKRSMSENVPSSEDVLKSLDTLKSTFSCQILENYVDVSQYEVYLSKINSMTYADIFTHLRSLRVEYIQKLLRPILQSLMSHTRNNNVFNHPVDPVALGLKDYFIKISHPMDLGTVKSRLLQGYYQTVQACVDDISLVFSNATLFNPVQNIVHQMAVFLNNVFLEDMKTVQEKVFKDEERRNNHSCERCQGKACPSCGEKCHKWEPPIIVCHGQCGQRIKRLGIYYVSTDGTLLYCQKCYTTSGPVVSTGGDTPTPSATTPLITTDSTADIRGFSPRPAPFTPSHCITTPNGDGSQTPKALLKKDMLKRRFDEEIFEPWIDCATCHRRVHQVCALYNPFYEKSLFRDQVDAVSSNAITSASATSESGTDSVSPKCSGLSSSAVTKMVTRKRGHHNKGSHLHESRSRSYSISSSKDEDENAVKESEDNNLFHCAICKLKAAVTKSKRGKRGASDDLNKRGKGNKKAKHSTGDTESTTDATQTSSVPEHELVQDPVVHMKYEKSDISQHSVVSGQYEKPTDTKVVVEDILQATVTANVHSTDTSCSKVCTTTSSQSDHPCVSRDLMDVDECIDDTPKGSSILKKSGIDDNASTSGVDSRKLESSKFLDCNTSYKTPHQTKIKQEVSESELESDTKPSDNNRWCASALPRTKLSDFIEAMVRHRIRNCQHTKEANENEEHTADKDTNEDFEVFDVESILNSLTIRVVANASRSMDVPDIISDNLPTQDGNRVPPYFVYRQKCILLFQKIDGIDVCLFCLYVQEFDDSCPEPNKSRVYIAYLDSVEYFRPRRLRTAVYFEIIISYLKWAQARGFKYGHIWACPPQRGDNFIFWCHPSQQRTPSRDRLTSWYNAMLLRAKTLGICSSVKNLWTCFFEGYGKRDDGLQRQASKNSYVGKQHHTKKSSKQLKKILDVSKDDQKATCSPDSDKVPTCPPVFEGDFWVTECSRVYRLVHTRTQGVRYDKDKTLNQRKCREFLKSIMTNPIAYAFNQPVDPVLLNIPDYPLIVKTPMDFSTIREKLRSNAYRSMLNFAQDMRLTCNNAMLYNPPAHVIHEHAKKLLTDFEKMMTDMVIERVGEVLASSNHVDAFLVTYPVNSAMEKEEKKLRLKEQHRQRQLLTGQQTEGGSLATRTATSVNSDVISDIDPRPAQPSAEEVSDVMEIDESDQKKLDSLLVDTTLADSRDNAAGDSPSVESIHNTLCDTRRVFFSSPTEQCIDEKPEQRSDVGSDGYGFMDIESSETGQSDSESRSIGMSDGNESNDNDSVCDKTRDGADRTDKNGENDLSLSTASTRPPYFSSMGTIPEGSGTCEESGIAMPSISRLDSMESVISVAERWPRRPDRTSSMCVEEAMEATSVGITVADHTETTHSTPASLRASGGLSIDIAATQAVPLKPSTSTVGRKNSLNSNLPFDKPQLGVKGAQALMSELSRNVCRLKDDMYVLIFSSPSASGGESTSIINNHDYDSSESISDECLLMLQGIQPDTSDPDPSIRSPFIESRQTFLEMCQFRHLQFDCLRRAKYSSSLLLFHLLFPKIESTRIHCSICRKRIKNVRWHCDSCHSFPHFELCNSCKFSTERIPHEHEDNLTPIRVTYS